MQIVKVIDLDRITSFNVLTLITLDPSTFLNQSKLVLLTHTFYQSKLIKTFMNVVAPKRAVVLW